MPTGRALEDRAAGTTQPLPAVTSGGALDANGAADEAARPSQEGTDENGSDG